jgi:transposase-like protein
MLCPYCDKEIDPEERKEIRKVKIRNDAVEYEDQFYRCPECSAEWSVEGFDFAVAAYRIYEEKHRLYPGILGHGNRNVEQDIEHWHDFKSKIADQLRSFSEIPIGSKRDIVNDIVRELYTEGYRVVRFEYLQKVLQAASIMVDQETVLHDLAQQLKNEINNICRQ